MRIVILIQKDYLIKDRTDEFIPDDLAIGVEVYSFQRDPLPSVDVMIEGDHKDKIKNMKIINTMPYMSKIHEEVFI